MDEYGAITCMDTRSFINVHKIEKKLTLTYLSNGYKTKPFIIKRRFLSVNAAISRLIDSLELLSLLLSEWLVSQ